MQPHHTRTPTCHEARLCMRRASSRAMPRRRRSPKQASTDGRRVLASHQGRDVHTEEEWSTPVPMLYEPERGTSWATEEWPVLARTRRSYTGLSVACRGPVAQPLPMS